MASTNELKSPLPVMIDGRFYRLDFTLRDLGSQDDLIQQVSGRSPVNVMRAFTVGDNPVSIQILNKSFTCFTRIPELMLNTVFDVTPEGVIFPIFKNAPAPGGAQHSGSLRWRPEEVNMSLYFAVTFVCKGGIYESGRCYLFAPNPSGHGTLLPPLPNLHNDGHVCMGDSFHCRKTSLADSFKFSLDHFLSSRWNSDLYSDVTVQDIMALFSFRDGKQLPPPDGYKWEKISRCCPISNQFISELPINEA